MKWTLKLYILIALMDPVWAQVSPSTIGIIQPGQTQTPAADLSSSRYQSRPKVKKPKTSAEDYEKAQLPPTKVMPEKTQEEGSDSPPISLPENSSTLAPPPPVEPLTQLPSQDSRPMPPPMETPQEESGLLKQARDMVVGGSPKDLDEYRNFLPPDDPRRNILELRAAPLYIYNDSSSPYWYRNYQNSMPGFLLSMNIWFTTLFGFEGSYRKSIAGALNNSPTRDEYIFASHEWINIGFRFRRFFGYGENVPLIVFGMDYYEYNFKVPSDDQNRVRIKTVSPKFSLATLVPTTNRYSWRYDLEVLPFARHTELGTGYDLKTGTESESFGFGLGIGGEYKLARTNRMYFKLSYYLERTSYSGPSNRADPLTSRTPSNVPVNNSFTIFEFGYIWGQ